MLKNLKKIPVMTTDLFTVYDDEVELPSGERKMFHSVIRKPSVTVIPIDNKGNIHLIDQYRYLHQKWLIEAVAGIIEEGEDTLDAAKRELKEELGIVASKWKDLGTIKAAGSIITWDQTLFLATGLTFEDQELEDSEDIRPIEMTIEDAVASVMTGKIGTYSTACGIFMVAELQRHGILND